MPGEFGNCQLGCYPRQMHLPTWSSEAHGWNFKHLLQLFMLFQSLVCSALGHGPDISSRGLLSDQGLRALNKPTQRGPDEKHLFVKTDPPSPCSPGSQQMVRMLAGFPVAFVCLPKAPWDLLGSYEPRQRYKSPMVRLEYKWGFRCKDQARWHRMGGAHEGEISF